ncbi:histidine phosphatase family protein [Sporosarcina sp. FSL K6-3457]|uniref:histidine phosphatase family protein n=1 Tax=Sporosarcina sp. FSL K6-3457 TaxID=2978204 RepID=UPI0030F9669D
MTIIGLVRHGITEWNELGKAQGVSDIPLNKIGKQQALALANRLSLEQEWDVIITSDLSRAIETAQIVSTTLQLPISMYDERIREIDCGEIEGTTEVERIHKWGRNWREIDLGMKKYEFVSNRGLEFLEELVMAHKDKRVLVVSHGALIGLTLQRLLPEQFPKTSIDNTSLTILKNTENIWSCPLYNGTKHLDE